MLELACLSLPQELITPEGYLGPTVSDSSLFRELSCEFPILRDHSADL